MTNSELQFLTDHLMQIKSAVATSTAHIARAEEIARENAEKINDLRVEVVEVKKEISSQRPYIMAVRRSFQFTIAALGTGIVTIATGVWADVVDYLRRP